MGSHRQQRRLWDREMGLRGCDQPSASLRDRRGDLILSLLSPLCDRLLFLRPGWAGGRQPPRAPQGAQSPPAAPQLCPGRFPELSNVMQNPIMPIMQIA